MSRQWAQKKSGSNSSMPVQKSSSKQRPFSDPIYDAPAPKQTPSVQAKRPNVDWSRVTVESQSPAGVQAKLTVGAPGDKYEQEADAMANKVMTMPAPKNEEQEKEKAEVGIQKQELQAPPDEETIQRQTTRQKLSFVSESTIQRYQAGEKGHGGIEQSALVAAGFTPDEAAQTYLGNWLRDFSQLKDKKGAVPLINILALGEFGREISEQDLGTYVPSEHLDNPEGGETIEDKTYAEEYSPDPVKREHFKKLYSQLSPDQQAEYRKAEAEKTTISANAAKNKLPTYIERGKMHSKDKLIEAIKKGETPEGRKELGNALHAVEDYFSHSNFTEAAIWLLSKTHPTDMKPLLGRAGKIPLGLEGAANLDKKGVPQIVTGSYVSGANQTVSLIETLVTEVETGQLRTAFVKGALRKMEITGEMIGQKVAHIVGAPVKPISGLIGGGIGAVSGAGSGAIKGGKRGARIGGSLGRWLGGGVGELIGEGVGGVIGGVAAGAEGAVEGAVEGAAEGERIGEKILQIYGKELGIVITGGEIAITAAGAGVIMAAFPKIPALMASLIALVKSGMLDKAIEKKVEDKTKESAVEAKAKGVTGPTHSQLAKDAPDHALFDVSATLAREAVKEIGKAMKKAWSMNKGNDPTKPIMGGEDVTNLVDKYVCHPDMESWWQPIVLAAAKK